MNSDKVTQGVDRAPHRSLFYAAGFTDEELSKPLIGVVCAQSDIIPGHMHLSKLAEAVKAGIYAAGGTPVVVPAIGVCDGIIMWHKGMHYSLASRELIADSVETLAAAHCFDGLVLIPNCDKIVPGMLMAALRLNLPAIVCSGGPMLAGCVDGKKTSLSQMFEAVGAYKAGLIDEAELRRRARQYLSGLSPQARRTSDDALFARFLALPQVEAADTLLLYHGMGGEPDTARLLPALWARGKAVCLPRCLPGHGMEARLVRQDSALIPHPYGMLEPGEDCPLVGKDAIGLVLVPGLAFDPSGGRLGQGGGFYDRWLADYAGCTAALCRTALLLPQVPRAPHDRGVELVLTEHGLYRADAQRSGAQRPRSSPDGT